MLPDWNADGYGRKARRLRDQPVPSGNVRVRRWTDDGVSSDWRRELDIGTIYRPEVFTIGTRESIADAAGSMQYNEVSALPVFDGDRLAGIVTERDVVRAIADGVDPQETEVAEYMTEDPAWISPTSSVGEAAERMLELGVRHFPVMIGDEVLGMISIRDLLTEVQR